MRSDAGPGLSGGRTLSFLLPAGGAGPLPRFHLPARLPPLVEERAARAAPHASGRGDALIAAGGPLAAEVRDWRRLLSEEEDEEAVAPLRRHLRTGRPLGDWRVRGGPGA